MGKKKEPRKKKGLGTMDIILIIVFADKRVSAIRLTPGHALHLRFRRPRRRVRYYGLDKDDQRAQARAGV